jgi:hypothetical protein
LLSSLAIPSLPPWRRVCASTRRRRAARSPAEGRESEERKKVPRDRGAVTGGGLAVPGCPALGSAGQSPSELEALYRVAYVLQDFLTRSSLCTPGRC